jgi:hypothetical protein
VPTERLETGDFVFQQNEVGIQIDTPDYNIETEL